MLYFSRGVLPVLHRAVPKPSVHFLQLEHHLRHLLHQLGVHQQGGQL